MQDLIGCDFIKACNFMRESKDFSYSNLYKELTKEKNIKKIEVDYDYLNDVFNILEIDKLDVEDLYIKYYSLNVDKTINVVYRCFVGIERVFEILDKDIIKKFKTVEIPNDLYISLNEQVLQKTMPVNQSKSKVNKF